jgi:hypothetical protein
VLRAHPLLTKEKVLAALRCADYLRNEDVLFGSPEAA